MMTATYGDIAERTATTIPAHLEAQATPPLAVSGWRQGDVYVVPTQASAPKSAPIGLAGQGHKVVSGDADRNSHILNGDGQFLPGTVTDRVADYGLLVVPDGGEAVLTHTGEHGSVRFGAGSWRVFGQVSYETELRRAAD